VKDAASVGRGARRGGGDDGQGGGIEVTHSLDGREASGFRTETLVGVAAVWSLGVAS
jgi:hypothetical protein